MSDKRTRIAAFIVLSFCLVVCPVRGQQAEPVDVIKVDANLVSVPVIVSDRNGHYVARLDAERFKLSTTHSCKRSPSSKMPKSL